MWLLDTKTHRLNFFIDHRACSYAILSHRWLDANEEVVFEDVNREPFRPPAPLRKVAFDGQSISMRDLQHFQIWNEGVQRTRRREGKMGWEKVRCVCKRALEDGHQYVWVDACCIDRSSSAELSESINSMYAWYENAETCYAYMADFEGEDILHDVEVATAFEASEWFSRGWTLQELIAPRQVQFFNADWKLVGDRFSLRKQIERRTRIPEQVLKKLKDPQELSIAQRMSWAATRITSRGEDLAYSLMGLFDINMPLLYGEGQFRAFQRLQREIIKTSSDQSIFAWDLTEDAVNSADDCMSIWAESPKQFTNCNEIELLNVGNWKSLLNQTNLGLEMELPIRCYDMDVYLAILNCVDKRHSSVGRVAIFLGYSNTFSDSASIVGRRLCRGMDRTVESRRAKDYALKASKMLIASANLGNGQSGQHHFGFSIECLRVHIRGTTYRLQENLFVIARPGTWDEKSQVLTLPPGTEGTAMCVAIKNAGDELPWVWLKLGFDQQFRPCLWYIHMPQLFKLYGHKISKKDTGSTITHGEIKYNGTTQEVETLLDQPIDGSADGPAHNFENSFRNMIYVDRQKEYDERDRYGLIEIRRMFQNTLDSWSWTVNIDLHDDETST